MNRYAFRRREIFNMFTCYIRSHVKWSTTSEQNIGNLKKILIYFEKRKENSSCVKFTPNDSI